MQVVRRASNEPNALVSTAFRTVASAVRGEQVVGMLLSTVPLAERMLLYHVAMTAWAMVPSGASWQSPASCVDDEPTEALRASNCSQTELDGAPRSRERTCRKR